MPEGKVPLAVLYIATCIGDYIMRKNILREKLSAGLPTVGTHVLSTWPTVVELAGQSGSYDYVEFTGEYSPFTMHDLDNLGRAFEVSGLGGMLKIEQTQYTHQAMRAIGSGFQSVLFADIRSVEDATAAVEAVRAETGSANGSRGRGRMGVGMRRDVGTILEGGKPSYVDALNDVVIAIMVEKKSCVDDLEAILSVPGLDMVQFGPSDYSMSIGKTGQTTDPEVVAAERKTIEMALAKGLHPVWKLVMHRRRQYTSRWVSNISASDGTFPSWPTTGRRRATRCGTCCLRMVPA